MPKGSGETPTRGRSLSAPAAFLPPIEAPQPGHAAQAAQMAPLPAIPIPTQATLPVLPALSATPSSASAAAAAAGSAFQLTDDTKAAAGKRGRAASRGAPPERRSTRGDTVAATQKSETAAEARSNAPARGHPTSGGRALEPAAGAPTELANASRLALAAPSTPNSRPVMVVYGGQPSPGGHLEGMPLSGPHIDRSGWSQDQKTLSHRLGAALEAEGHHGAPHAGGEHFAEVAHHRQQATGGFTDAAGAVPAAVGSNIQDMAHEESHAKIAQSLRPDQVREVNTANIHAVGPHAGTLNSRTRDLFAREDPNTAYSLAYHQLQDGQRDIPDKDEVRALRDNQTAAALRTGSAAAPAAASSGATGSVPRPFTISATSTPAAPPVYTAATKNDSGNSDFMSGIRSPGRTWRTGADAAEWHESFNHYAAQGHARPAAAASADHQNTGSRVPPFIAPPSPLVLPPVGTRQATPPAPPPSAASPPVTASAAAAAGHAASTDAAPALKRRGTI